ncbi:hypothetical protein BC938DRAFT_482121 [Jimgerdemannia flammicorona]|uniref:Uncharacterized protein n=1 Tax=Jimgerdemannia flammicorona TaxID=994334 RepID=A0A433QEM8_9FUNG|nr:hypothetical protein BC938DRAFT_482121 [Jimgerdemannia flammicorona]
MSIMRHGVYLGGGVEFTRKGHREQTLNIFFFRVIAYLVFLRNYDDPCCPPEARPIVYKLGPESSPVLPGWPTLGNGVGVVAVCAWMSLSLPNRCYFRTRRRWLKNRSLQGTRTIRGSM